MRRAGSKKAAALFVVSLFVSGLFLTAGSVGAAGADEDPRLDAVSALAVASGQRATLTASRFLALEEFFDGPGPVSESTFDGLSGGTSYASFPYPGTATLGYPSYVALATGDAPPGYPFYVRTTAGEDAKVLSGPTDAYRLEATADREAAASLARVRGSVADTLQAGSAATTSIKVENGKRVATAESRTDGLAIGGTLKIGSVYSKSVTTYAAGDGAPTTTTELRLDGGVVNDQRFSFSRQGLTVTQAGVPVPVSEALTSLNAALKPAGLSVRFLDPEPILGGAQAGTFEVTMTEEVPGYGAGVLRLRLGQATTAIVPDGNVLPPVTSDEGSSDQTGGPAFPDPSEAVPSPAAAEAGDAPLPAGSEEAQSGAETGGWAPESTVNEEGSLGGGAALAESPDGARLGSDQRTDPAGAGLTTVARPARAASAAVPRAVDGVVAAIVWAAVGLLGMSIIWRRGERAWTS